ncbi:MAG: endopeptidase La [Salinivirgaceae bacterium]|nr:endopeptidase La [Salinivirgaceae bacterium]
MEEFNLDKILGSEKDGQDGEFFPIISDDDQDSIDKFKFPELLPILPLRNMVLFPGVVMPISVGRDKSMRLIREAYKNDKIIGTVSQIDPNIEEPKAEDLHRNGTVAVIMKILEMPDNSTTVIIQGKRKFSVREYLSEEPYFTAYVSPSEEKMPTEEQSEEFEALVSSIKDLSQKIIKLSPNIPSEAIFAIKNIDNPFFLINFICANSELKVTAKQKLLEEPDLFERSIKLLELLSKEIQMLELKEDIQFKVKSELDKQQREYLLNQQIKTIQNELGGNPVEKEIADLKAKAKDKKWKKEVSELFEKETDKLNRLNPATGEYSVQLNYLQVLLDLPWDDYSEDKFDMKYATKVLDRDHFGLEKVKDRILEHLAVLKLKGDLKSPILCLYGPPGVGKTSLGKSVANALGRKYVRMSLGGLHDEAEVRGHRKTYIGAMPGRIIQNIKKAGSSNPVFILDEIDKVSKDFHGDPASALLEVLDPEQNNAFHDNYLEIDYDLSKVMFIATANTVGTISPPLRDRMEMIDVSGYIIEEKIEIAKRHLVPKQLKNHGVDLKAVSFSKKTIEAIVVGYTRESGVRELDKRLAQVARRIAKRIAFEEAFDSKIEVEHLEDLLGKKIYNKELYDGNEFAGVVTGLAWTAVGGDILYIETSLSKGKGKLTITGNLGDVMKESTVIALEIIKSRSQLLGINSDLYDNWNVHVHVPEGAIPKDGPSAGITMVTSLASAFTQRKVKSNLAMTGEITLRGKVLPVGGIREKILAAKRANIKEIIVSSQNQKDVEDIKPEYVKGVTFHYVDTIDEVLNIALLNQKVKNPVDFTLSN